MKKHILVTGGAGYIGSHTAKALSLSGYVPVTFDNMVYGHRWAVKWGPLIEGDLGDTAAIERVLKDYPIEGVIHFAAYAYVGESMTSPEKYFRNNAINTLHLLEAMKAAGVHDLVFSSTCATYGVPGEVPIPEDHPQRPINPYGESKLFIERVLHWHHLAHGLNYAALRYFNAAGADLDGEIGEAHDPETHLIPLAIESALGLRKGLEIYGTDYPTPDGTAVRDYIHVADLADAHVRALRHLASGGESLRANLGTGHGHSVREVISAVERVGGRPVPVRECPRRPGDPPELVAAPTRAGDVLHWTPRFSDLDTIISSAWRWHQQQVGRVDKPARIARVS
ncbi:UDP-glucose 4-epimerase GalE [Methylolobus aquaticus]